MKVSRKLQCILVSSLWVKTFPSSNFFQDDPGVPIYTELIYFNVYAPEWSSSNFSCSLTSNITSHSMKNLGFHSWLRWKMITLPLLTTSPIYFSSGRLGECTFWTWEWKGQRLHPSTHWTIPRQYRRNSEKRSIRNKNVRSMHSTQLRFPNSTYSLEIPYTQSPSQRSDSCTFDPYSVHSAWPQWDDNWPPNITSTITLNAIILIN